MSDDWSMDDLVLSSGTLHGVSFADRVTAAAKAGFEGVGLRKSDYKEAVLSGLGDDDLLAVLDDHGVRVVELESLFDWAMDGERGRRARRVEESFFALADLFAARHLVVVGGSEGATDRVAERFADLCSRAEAHGLLVALEFLPWTAIPDAATAWWIVREAGAANGGILVDSWHYFRGAANPGQLEEIPADRIVALHIDDAGPPRADPLEDTLHFRRLPGDGEFDLVEFVRLLHEKGVRAPLGIEVLSDELARLPPDRLASRAAAATRSVLRAARARPSHR